MQVIISRDFALWNNAGCRSTPTIGWRSILALHRATDRTLDHILLDELFSVNNRKTHTCLVCPIWCLRSIAGLWMPRLYITFGSSNSPTWFLPLTVVEYNNLSRGQLDSESTGAMYEQEDAFLTPKVAILVYCTGTVIVRGLTINTAMSWGNEYE